MKHKIKYKILYIYICICVCVYIYVCSGLIPNLFSQNLGDKKKHALIDMINKGLHKPSIC